MTNNKFLTFIFTTIFIFTSTNSFAYENETNKSTSWVCFLTAPFATTAIIKANPSMSVIFSQVNNQISKACDKSLDTISDFFEDDDIEENED